MAANTSGYSRSQPSGSSSIRDGDDLIRSDKSILEETLNSEHFFTPQTSASSLSGGVHRPGSARVFFGTRASLATPSSSDSEGRLYLATDTGALIYMHASSTSTIVGGSQPAGFRALHLSGALASASSATFGFAAPTYDVGGFLSVSSSQASVPLAHGGHYVISGHIEIPSAATDTRYILAITKNGGTIPIAMSSTNTHGALNVMCLDRAAVGDKYDLVFRHALGVNASLNSGHFAMQKV